MADGEASGGAGGAGGAGRGRGRRPRKEEAVDGAPPIEQVPAPDGVGGMVKQVMTSNEPMLQPQFPRAWKELFPETPLAYRSWGYERLGDFLDAFPESVSRSPVEGRKENALALPGVVVPDMSKPVKEPRPPSKPSGPGGEFAAGLAATVAARAGGDAAAVQAFLEQEQFRFTIDSLVRSFNAQTGKPRAPRRKRGLKGGEAGAAEGAAEGVAPDA